MARESADGNATAIDRNDTFSFDYPIGCKHSAATVRLTHFDGTFPVDREPEDDASTTKSSRESATGRVADVGIDERISFAIG